MSIDLTFMGIKHREMTGVGVTEIREPLYDGGFVRMNIVNGFTAVVKAGGHSFIFLCVLSVYCGYHFNCFTSGDVGKRRG
jgi:hypothetical protein